MAIESKDSSDPEGDEGNDKPVAELGEKLINITLLAGSNKNQAPSIHTPLLPTLQNKSAPTPHPLNVRTPSRILTLVLASTTM